ncbi:MAG: Radical domain protein, partial [Hyphomicrobiales bacterium]|nr:Radical domain protein [Hyphomicrobiales bacterium]
PSATLNKLGVDVVVRGECEEVVTQLASGGNLANIPSIAYREGQQIIITGAPAPTRFTDLPALHWPDHWIARHDHHHHRFGTQCIGLGAEVEASRGCPYSCSFCAKTDYRDSYRKRDLKIILDEIDALRTQGARYIYFIDEIFLPQRPLLEALADRDLSFGIQTRIDLWKPDMLDLLGQAGCVSIEAGIESLTREGRAMLDKMCRLSTDELSERLIHARRRVPFVQANLIKTSRDDCTLIDDWRTRLHKAGVWANDPVPLYPYPSSPDYRKLWGPPDDEAWERAHTHYLAQFQSFSDIQDERPAPLQELEASCLKP